LRHPALFTLHQAWLLYYYMSLALRENILQVNGSNIMNWWIYHHYITMLISFLMMCLPDGGIVSTKLEAFFTLCLAQGIVMAVQNSYQSKRLYVRKTLGKASYIDVDASETLVEKPSDLKVLVPMLFIVYVSELYMGLDLAYFVRRHHPAGSWLLLAAAFLFIVLAIGNSVSTASVLVAKNKERRQRRKSLLIAKSPTNGAKANQGPKKNT